MSDPTPPDHDAVAPDLEIALADFLPDGVTVDSDAEPADAEAVDLGRAAEEPEPTGGAAPPADDTTGPEAPVEPAEGAAPTADEADAIASPVPAAADDIDLTLLDAVEHDLGAVDAALAALDDGSYGTCAVCRTPIPADLLAADPVRRTCPQHV